jgi:DNA-binding response OmpR family regulator
MDASTIKETRAARIFDPGRLTRVFIETDAGQLEARMTARGNWELRLRRAGEQEWRLACRDDIDCGAIADDPAVNGGERVLIRGGLQIDQDTRTVSVNGSRFRFPSAEYTILLRLARHPGRVIEARELIEELYGDADPSRRNALKSHICRLRRRLRKAGIDNLVVSCWGVGYRLWEQAEAAPRLPGR